MVLTKKQKEVYDFVVNFIAEKGYSPTLEEIAAGLGLRSLSTVQKHVSNLVEKGVLRRGWNRGRSIEALPLAEEQGSASSTVEINLLGRVAAGLPIEAIETPIPFTVPESMLGRGETFALQVKGDSMIDEQIRDGDFVIVEKRDTAENGETVVALIRSSEATLKKFYREGANIRLQPANSALDPIVVPASEVSIQGVVIGVIRFVR